MKDTRSLAAVALSGGGARGAYQAGVLARIAERLGHDFPFPIVTGVSAGGINATALASSQGGFRRTTRDMVAAWLRLSTEDVFVTTFPSLTGSFLRWLSMVLSGGKTPGFDVRGILDTRPLLEHLSRTFDLEGLDANLHAGRLRALALTATSYSTGMTTTFVHGVPEIPMWERARRRGVQARIGLEHVMASAALPIVFPAIRVGDDYFGDGAIRQSSPLSPAVHLGASRILAVSVRYGRRVATSSVVYPPPERILGMLMHGVFLDALENDVERLERINRTLELIPPGVSHPDGLRRIELLVLRPSRDLGELSAGMARYLPRSLRVLTRGLGASRDEPSDFLSYLLFERPYLETLIHLGYEDAEAQWEEIARFLRA
jgi:NTE family protein